MDELYNLLSIIEEDEIIALTCSPNISLLEYIRKVKSNVQSTIDKLENSSK